MKHNGIDIISAYHNGAEITSIMFNGVDVGAFTPPTPDYQPWENYPDSPVLTEDYPYQMVYQNTKLGVCVAGLSLNGSTYLKLNGANKRYELTNGEWVFSSESATSTSIYVGSPASNSINECNADVYTNGDFLTVYFAKTTG